MPRVYSCCCPKADLLTQSTWAGKWQEIVVTCSPSQFSKLILTAKGEFGHFQVEL